ncbi:tyrosine-type recombinase/integrase [Aliarcobacter butzleri]|uniref:tyrosine-type recombinase/integrase n=1 Tax=Aliarcobacter butzleri TaxID=28197 RepID=UPI001260F577|nr:tyrosine-type recombinase/integrase [Aliarcobacter butzleri]
MSKIEFIKRIPLELQNKLELKRFKISLIKCLNSKQVKLAKMLLEFKTKEIFTNSELQKKHIAIKYLKDSLETFLLSENIKNFDLINEKVSKTINIITMQDILNKAIEQRKIDFEEKQKLLSKQGVNTDLKKDSVLGAYKSMLKSVDSYFGLNYDINNLNLDIVEQYSKTISGTYVGHFKSIFKAANKKNDNIINWFDKLETTISQKFSDINKEINIFYYPEIENIQNSLKEESKYCFLALLYSGMRLDELASIKKQDVKNNCFLFFDSKNYFKKIIPIHNNIIDYINNKMEKLENEDYLFFPKCKGSSRVNTIRYEHFNSKPCFKDIKKTLHNTRSTFITYVNYFKENFKENDIKSLTHKAKGMDQEKYNKTNNINNLRKIINAINLEKLNIIQDQIENFGFELDTNEVL